MMIRYQNGSEGQKLWDLDDTKVTVSFDVCFSELKSSRNTLENSTEASYEPETPQDSTNAESILGL